MAWEDTLTSIEGAFDPLDILSFEDSLETTAEKKARQAREKAAKLAQDELDFKKGVYEENKGSWNDLSRDLFGRTTPEDIEALAQEFATRRAGQGGFESSNVTTPSGRGGQFDFGSPDQLTSDDVAGSIPEDRLRNLYDSSRIFSENEFKRRVKALEAETGSPALSDEQIRNLYDTGRNASYDDYKNKHLSAQTTLQQEAAVTNAPITEYDRQRALAQIEENRKNTLPGQLDAARGKHQDAVDKLTADLDAIAPITAGDFQNEWNVDENKEYVSPEARDAQRTAMDKTLAWTDTQETAAEKLMREVARRAQERDLRAQRESMNNDLRTRGAYGSGAELAGALGAQQEMAQRRSLEEMTANANAQERSLKATELYGNQGFNLGQQDIQTGMAQDMNSRFNSEAQQGWQKHKTKTEQEEAERVARVSATKADARTGVADKESSDAKWLGNFKAGITSGKAGNNFTGAQIVGDAQRSLGQNFREQALGFDADAAEQTHNGFL